MKVLLSKNIKNLRDRWLQQDGNLDPLTNLKIKNPTLDHNHVNGYCRGVLDNNSNQFLGKVEGAFKRYIRHQGFLDSDIIAILDRTKHYILTNHENLKILHPESLSTKVKRFSRMKTEEQVKILMSLGVSFDNILKSKKERTIQYRRVLNGQNILKF